jgi:NAD(P)-dependent dehydrogenase (short-subunit alcohol dehydrogenase family)
MLKAMESLQDKACLVTGGTRGIGRAIAGMLLQEGARVAISGRTPESVSKALEAYRTDAGNKVTGKAADLRNYGEIEDLFRYVDSSLGGLDVLVNNAGIGVFGPVDQLRLEDWKSTIETNLYGSFYCSRMALTRFETSGGGFIVNIGSLAGAHAFAGGVAYNASKFGLTGFSEALMQDVRSRNVRVSYVMPGSVATEFGGGTASGMDWKVSPEDVAEVVRMILKMPARTLVSRIEVRPSQPKSK